MTSTRRSSDSALPGELRTPASRQAAVAAAGLAALLAANYFLRHTLERGDVYIYSFFDYFFPTVEKLLFSRAYPWHKLLLPIPELAGAWTATTLIVTHLIEMRLTPPVTWYVYNAALIIVSFATSWLAFRSLACSFTFAICMGFGTQLYATYATTGSMGLCLLLMYYEIVLLCSLRLIEGAPRRTLWRAAFVLSLVVTVLAYESWLDFAVFLWLAAALVAAVGLRFGKREWWPGLLFCAAWLAAACAVYLYIKLHLGYGQVAGAESDVVFNYPTLAPKVEDVLSNVLTQFYIVVTNFLPPTFMSSTAFYTLGGDRIVELQHGYHSAYSYLVVMQYLFLWRYYAGAAAVVFAYVLVRTLRRTLTTWSPDAFAVSIFLLMAATGGPTHAFVKARPMNSMPLLGYHVIVGVMGVALLLSYLAMRAVASPRRWNLGWIAVGCIWATVFWSALSRPAVLAHEAAQVGLGESIYPNPQATLGAMFGRTIPLAAGATQYRLMKFMPAEAVKAPASFSTIVPFGERLDPLPTEAANLDEWTKAAGVTVSKSATGYRVVSNAVDGGYQLSSRQIRVPSHHRLLARMQGTMERGHVCLGILNQSERWLLPPAAEQTEFSVDTGDNTAVMFVLINCGRIPGSDGISVFDLRSLSYALLMDVVTDAGLRK